MAPEQNPNHDEASEKIIRLVRPSVVVLCGPAACGKSSFAERYFRPTQIISSDWARARVCDDERDQRFQTQAFALVHFLIEQRLSLNRLCVVDSTALTTPARKDLLDLARRYQVPCVVFLFDIPLEKCLERDEARERMVGRAVILRQYQAFEQAKSSLRQEGFDQVVELRDEDLRRARIEIIFRPVARSVTNAARPPLGTMRRGPRPPQVGPGAPATPREMRPAPARRPPAAAPPPSQPEARPPASTPGAAPATASVASAPSTAPAAPPSGPAAAATPQEPSTPAASPPSSGEPQGQGGA